MRPESNQRSAPESIDGRRVFYDINANSNLRPSVAAAFGFDPFERVVDFLERHLGDSRSAGFQACVESGLKAGTTSA